MKRARFPRDITYRALMGNHRSCHGIIGIISCKILREKQEYNDLWQKVLKFLTNDHFTRLVNDRSWHLAVTGGTFARIANERDRVPLYRTHMHGLAPSALGVIQLANLAVSGRLVAVTFFNHMEDLYADSPQNLCLRRICNHFGVPLLEDISSIEYVFRKSPPSLKKACPIVPATFRRQMREYDGYGRSRDYVCDATGFSADNRDNRSAETIAVVAHDRKKTSMLEFCLRHADELLSYRRVVSTGTTGEILRSQMKAYLLGRGTSRPVPERWKWSPTSETVDQFLGRKIQPLRSGPDGGDVQISAKVIDGTCHRVLFFQDPDSAHPHQVDVRLLEKAVQDPIRPLSSPRPRRQLRSSCR